MVVKLDARPPPKQDEEIDLTELNTFDILARTRYIIHKYKWWEMLTKNIGRYHLEKDDLEQALRYMNLLKGEPQNVASDWLQELRIHLETVQAVNAIMTYAAVQAIESMWNRYPSAKIAYIFKKWIDRDGCSMVQPITK